MAVPSLVKQPGESRLYTMDFSLLLAEGETIASVDSVTVDPDDSADPGGLQLNGAAAATGDGTGVDQRIEDGIAGTRYKVTMVVTTSDDNVLEGEGILHVRDI